MKLDQFGLLETGGKVVEKPEILFARVDIKELMEKVEADKAANAQAQSAAAPAEEAETEEGIDIEPKAEIHLMTLRSCSSRWARLSPAKL